MNDQELPGMWEEADFLGGETDMNQKPIMYAGRLDMDMIPSAIATQLEYLQRMIDRDTDWVAAQITFENGEITVDVRIAEAQ